MGGGSLLRYESDGELKRIFLVLKLFGDFCSF